ncbi:MAG: glycosyltransferase family 4 protein [Candidatus Omnitrophica bacterium]|nr:glycosyltransferase family 4 protein [Candidatus Omnitrophota bacterium]
MKQITVCYIKLKKDSFISNVLNTAHFLNALSEYAKVITIEKTSHEIDFNELEALGADYVLADIKNFGAMQFILREKQNINIPFILIMRTVSCWLDAFLHIIPLIRKEDIIISPSQYAKEAFLKIAKGVKVNVIVHCIDVQNIQNTIKNAHSFSNKSIKRIAFMGRLIPDKGPGILIDCMPKIISKVKTASLDIVSPLGDKGMNDFPLSSYARQLKQKVRKLGLSARVNFTGFKAAPDKYHILSQTDVFVLPTTTEEENFSIASLEALACGIPVITTDYWASKEFLTHGVNGYLINTFQSKNAKLAFDKKQLISFIIKVLKDKKLSIRLKNTASVSARNYDYRKVMPQLVRLLKKRNARHAATRWHLIKNKRPIDFKNCFNKDFLFFLHYLSFFEKKTYADLCGISKKPVRKKKSHNFSKDIISLHNKTHAGLLKYLTLSRIGL